MPGRNVAGQAEAVPARAIGSLDSPEADNFQGSLAGGLKNPAKFVE